METRSLIICCVGLAGVALSGCSTKAIVSKQRMTLADAHIENMECRADKPPDTNIARTICASPESWAVFDARRLRETEALLAEGRQSPNVGRFNRD